MPDTSEKDILNTLFTEEKGEVTLMEAEPKLKPEVESLIHKVEKEIYLAKPITDDAGQMVMQSPTTVLPIITLPLTQSTYIVGLTQQITESVRWLAEWCRRIIKMLGEKVVFREEETGTISTRNSGYGVNE